MTSIENINVDIPYFTTWSDALMLIAILCLFLVVLFWFSRKQYFRLGEKVSAAENILYYVGIKRVAEKKGIDIDRELMKEEIVSRSRNFRRTLKDQVYDELFKEVSDGKKKKEN